MEDSFNLYRGYLGEVWQFAILKEGGKFTLTSVLFSDKGYSSIKNAKRGAERMLADWLEAAGLEKKD